MRHRISTPQAHTSLYSYYPIKSEMVRRHLEKTGDELLRDPRQQPTLDVLLKILSFYQSYRVLEKLMATLRPRRGHGRQLDGFRREVKLQLL